MFNNKLSAGFFAKSAAAGVAAYASAAAICSLILYGIYHNSSGINAMFDVFGEHGPFREDTTTGKSLNVATQAAATGLLLALLAGAVKVLFGEAVVQEPLRDRLLAEEGVVPTATSPSQGGSTSE